MADSMINADNMLAALKAKMNAEMMEAAEPVIKEAVSKLREKMFA